MPNWDNFRYPPRPAMPRLADPYTGFVYADVPEPLPVGLPPMAPPPAAAIPRSPDNSVPLVQGTSGSDSFRYPDLGAPGFGRSPTTGAPKGFATYEEPVAVVNLSPVQAEEAVASAWTLGSDRFGTGNKFKGDDSFKDAPFAPVEPAYLSALPLPAIVDALELGLAATWAQAPSLSKWLREFLKGLWPGPKNFGFTLYDGVYAKPFERNCAPTYRYYAGAYAHAASCALPAAGIANGPTVTHYIMTMNVNECTGNPGCAAGVRVRAQWVKPVGQSGWAYPDGRVVPDVKVRRRVPGAVDAMATPISKPVEDDDDIPYAARPYLPVSLPYRNPVEQTWRGPVTRPVADYPGRLLAPPGFIELYPTDSGVSVRPIPGVTPVPVPLPPLPVPVVVGNPTIAIVGSFARPDRIFPRPPPARTRERKPEPVIAYHVLGHVTESIESVQAVWFALPPDCRSKPQRGRKTVEKHKMLWDIWHCFGRLDIETALWNLVTETFMDAVYGKPSRALRKHLSRTAFHEMTPQRGSRMRPKADVKKPETFGKAAKSTWVNHHTVDQIRRGLT